MQRLDKYLAFIKHQAQPDARLEDVGEVRMSIKDRLPQLASSGPGGRSSFKPLGTLLSDDVRKSIALMVFLMPSRQRRSAKLGITYKSPGGVRFPAAL